MTVYLYLLPFPYLLPLPTDSELIFIKDTLIEVCGRCRECKVTVAAVTSTCYAPLMSPKSCRRLYGSVEKQKRCIYATLLNLIF